MQVFSFRFMVALLLAAVLAGCASAPDVRPTAGMTTLPPPDTTSSSGAYEGGSDYRIGAQDLLDITVFGVKDLDREVRVNSNGQISLPLIGGVQAGGRTIPELEHAIEAKLAQKYLQNPQVSVFVKEYTSQRVTLEGALNKPGIYPLTGKTTLLQAIAIAGGFDKLAEQNGVVIFRQIDGKRMAAVFNVNSISTGKSADPQVYGDDIIVVQQSGSKNALEQFIRMAPVIGLFLLY